MKKSILITILFIIAGSLLASCMPEKPQDVLPYCQDQYEQILLEYPGFPKTFIGYCVAYFQTGKTIAFQGLCGSEIVWQIISDNTEYTITSRQECIQYFKEQ
jgi:hypothetical protein